MVVVFSVWSVFVVVGVCIVYTLYFFQAEDGIQGLPQSRGV